MVAAHVGRFRLGPPLIATSRIVDPEHAERLIAAGFVDAVGMTRALIADPELPVKAGVGRRILRCIGCNTCIAHYHAGTAIACAVNPCTGRELTMPAAPRASRARRVIVRRGWSRGAGRRGRVCRGRSGGRPPRALRPARRADGAGACRSWPPRSAVGSSLSSRDDWPTLASRFASTPRPRPRWFSTSSPLAPSSLTLAVASMAVGEGMHQYRCNLYLRRLYRAGVKVLQHHALVGATDGEVELSNVFASELHRRIPADLLVLAQGRVPEDELAPALVAAGLYVEEAGDCLSPRWLEEAVLEGTLAARRVGALA